MLKVKRRIMLVQMASALGLALCLLLAFPTMASGKEVSRYGVVERSYDGIRVATDSSSVKKGYIDEEGKIIVPLIYHYASDFINGVGLLSREDELGNNVYSAVNAKGETIIEFDQELGEVEYFNGKHGIVVKHFEIDPLDRYALIDGTGSLVTGYDYASLYIQGEPSDHEVLFAEDLDTGLRGVLRWDGSVIIPMDYTYIQNSKTWNPNILAVVKAAGENDYRCGYLYSNGASMLPCIYDEAEIFSEGFGSVAKDGQWAVINAQGQFVTDFAFDYLDVFREGMAVIWKNQKYGVIDVTGKEVVPCTYDYISNFAGGTARAELEGEGLILEHPLIQMRDINIYRGEKWIYTDQAPSLESGRVFAPFRPIAEALGYSVDWNNQSKQMIVQNKERIIRFTLGSNEASVNVFDDDLPPKVVLLDAPPRIINGRTMIPVRAIAECMGAVVEWDAEHRVVQIN